ncbi:amidohydrolase [Anoxybacillus kamchatkensis]|uniref:M20 peptidase aminoacylase family protein n=1 Tax=Anoxybacillus ayderensis TaxID=265546 RepID=UPI0015EC5CB8|nr:M20 peptidase aminoacylase family protein [Anoxybacillus ayderensis]MBA2877845.1 amidohydrolase [Anoxybacillus ayderensis]
MNNEQLQERLFELFDYLHTHPETSWNEYGTTKYIKQFLENEGVRYRLFDDCPGIVAEMGSGKPVVMVRADMDALWQEVDGEFRANHSCGHDAHMTIVMGLILRLKTLQWEQGTIRFLFQPAEEKGNGALKMIEKGVLDDVDYLFGVHLRPVEELSLKQASPSIRHGAAQFFVGHIYGDDCHGARPHQGVNAIDVISLINFQLKTIYFPPQQSYSIKMTKCVAGGENLNIIPGSAQFALDVRAETNELIQQMKQKVEQIIQYAETMGVRISYKWVDFVPAAEVSVEAEQCIRKGIVTVFGEEGCVPSLQTSGSEDFHFYTIQRPHVKAAMLGLGADLKPGLHHPHMTFDRSCMLDGVRILEVAVMEALKGRG